MPIHNKFIADFNEKSLYHVYNKTNNRELLFLSDENRYYFLEKYREILSSFVDTFCWCLMPNHFHLLIRIKPEAEIARALFLKEEISLTMTERKFMSHQVALGELIERTFKRFFQSYAMAFNKMHNRNGNLFYKPFKRVMVEKENHFSQAVVYIHANPAKHQLTENFMDYQWSSVQDILSNDNTWLLRNEVIDWFGNKERLVKKHIDWADHYCKREITIESYLA
jgi:putative transposase